MKRPEHMQGTEYHNHLQRRSAHMGQPVGWNGRVYGAEEEIKGYEHATQTPLKGEEGEKEYHEWHYAHLVTEEGDFIMVGFVTKQLFAASLGPAPISPGVAVDCVMQDGTKIDTLTYYKHYLASREKLDIQIGDSWLRAEDDNANRIRLHVQSGGIVLDVIMSRTVPAFRSKTGKTIYGDGTKWEAWDIVQPEATMEGHLTIKGTKRPIRGKAYVDHAYGNEMFGVNHWYWATADVGPYTFVVAASYTADKHMVSNKRDHLVAFMMAKDGRVVGRDPEKALFIPGPKKFVPAMRRHVAEELKYRYIDDGKEYLLTLKQKNILRVKPLLTMVVKNRLIGLIAETFVVGGPYLRATYDTWLEVRDTERLIGQYGPEDCRGQVIGEIFYPGKDDLTDYPQSA